MLTRPRVHDLLRLDAQQVDELGSRAVADGATWVPAALARANWAVVRRTRPDRRGLPIGVRGATRDQRWGGFHDGDPAEVWHPADLRAAAAPRPDLAPVRALALLEGAVVPAREITMGPGGSCGFEIATSLPTMTDASDLDLVIHAPTALDADQIGALDRLIDQSAGRAGCRIDTLIETPWGAVHLTELATSRHGVVLRTPDGPVVTDRPWHRPAPTDEARP